MNIWMRDHQPFFVQIMELLKLFERSNLFFFYRVNSLLLDSCPSNFWWSSQIDNESDSKIKQWAISQEFEPFVQNWKLRIFDLSALVKVLNEAISVIDKLTAGDLHLACSGSDPWTGSRLLNEESGLCSLCRRGGW